MLSDSNGTYGNVLCEPDMALCARTHTAPSSPRHRSDLTPRKLKARAAGYWDFKFQILQRCQWHGLIHPRLNIWTFKHLRLRRGKVRSCVFVAWNTCICDRRAHCRIVGQMKTRCEVSFICDKHTPQKQQWDDHDDEHDEVQGGQISSTQRS